MPTPSPEVRTELEAILRADNTRLGQVYRLMRRGLDANQIAGELGVATAGFVSNNRTYIAAILEGAIPNGPSIAHAARGRVRRILKEHTVSAATQGYLADLLAHLDEQADRSKRPNKSEQTPVSESGPRHLAEDSLRFRVEKALRDRTAALVERIKVETQIDADDYYQIVSDSAPLDVLYRLCELQASSVTTRALHRQHRLDLAIETALVEWSEDLPLTSNVVGRARARMEYWRSDVIQ